MNVRDQKEFVAGILFAAIGAAAFLQSLVYQMGTITRMGPGYYPACVGIGLVVTGSVSIIRGLRYGQADRIENLHWQDMAVVLGGVLLFALLIDRLGLVEAIVALVVTSCLGRITRRPIEVVVITIALTILAVGVFVYGLNIPVSLY